MLTTIRNEIRKGIRRQGQELTKEDVGKCIDLASGFGNVLPIDVGKRIWSKDFGIAMESDEQRDKRKSK
jgi:hypothetical protein